MIDFTNNPTIRVTYIINLIDVIFFFFISLIIRYVVNKNFLKNEQKKQSNLKGLNKTMLIILFAIVMLINKKVYAIIAMTTYVVNISTITIYFIGIYIANFIVEIIVNHKDINKTKLLEIFSETVIENIIFNTILIVGIITSNNYYNYMGNTIIFAGITTLLYKIIKILLKKDSVIKKILIVVLYILILLFVGRNGMIQRYKYKGKGILLKRVMEGRENSIRDDISIEYDIDIDNY